LLKNNNLAPTSPLTFAAPKDPRRASDLPLNEAEAMSMEAFIPVPRPPPSQTNTKPAGADEKSKVAV
jgi:hypothetical protein